MAGDQRPHRGDEDQAGPPAGERILWSPSDHPGSRSAGRRAIGEQEHGSTYRTLAQLAGVSVVDVRCRWHAGARMREQFQTFGLSLTRQGFFVRHTRTADQLGDSASAYFEQPGHEQFISHPLPVPGTTTVIVLSDDAMARYAGDVAMPDRPIPVRPVVHVDHAALLADLRWGIDSPELDARLTWFIGKLVETSAPGRLTSRRLATARSHQRIVDYAREAIAANPASLDLQGIAMALGHTPFHVSRTFRRATGTTLTQHRNNVRAATAIDRITQGDDRLANLAADLGFFDQSHLARVLLRTVRLAPGRIRHRVLRASPGPECGQRRPRRVFRDGLT